MYGWWPTGWPCDRVDGRWKPSLGQRWPRANPCAYLRGVFEQDVLISQKELPSGVRSDRDWQESVSARLPVEATASARWVEGGHMEPGRVCPCPFRRAHTNCSVRRKSGSAHSCGAGSPAVAPEVGVQPTSWTDARWPQGARWVLTDWAPTLDRALLTWCPGDTVLRAPGDRSRGRHPHRDRGVHRFRPKRVLLSSEWEWRFDRGLGRAAETRVACIVRAHTRPHRPQGRSVLWQIGRRQRSARASFRRGWTLVSLEAWCARAGLVFLPGSVYLTLRSRASFTRAGVGGLGLPPSSYPPPARAVTVDLSFLKTVWIRARFL